MHTIGMVMAKKTVLLIDDDLEKLSALTSESKESLLQMVEQLMLQNEITEMSPDVFEKAKTIDIPKIKADDRFSSYPLPKNKEPFYLKFVK